MATKYVRSTATDDNGDGTVDADSGADNHYAFKTINHALNGTNKISAGDTLNIHSGNYTGETSGSGYLNIPKYASTTTIQKAPGDPTNPVISSDLSSGTMNCWIGAWGTGDAKLVFNNLTWTVPAGKNVANVMLYSGGISFTGCNFIQLPTSTYYILSCGFHDTESPISFTNCNFTAATTAVGDTAAGLAFTPNSGYVLDGLTLTNCTVTTPGQCLYIQPTVQGEVRNVTITGCTFKMTGGGGVPVNSVRVCLIEKVNRHPVLTDKLTITDSTFIGPLWALDVSSTEGIEITNCKFYCDTILNPASTTGGTYSVSLGGDGAYAGTGSGVVSGTMSGCYLYNYNSHTLLVGYGADGVTVDSCNLVGGNYNAVLKHCTNCTLSNSTCLSGPPGTTYANVYLKSGTNTQATGNTIVATGTSRALYIGRGDSDAACTSPTVTGNKVICRDTAVAYLVAHELYDAELAGTVTVNDNTFDIDSTATYGTIGERTEIASLPEVRTAWGVLDTDYLICDASSAVSDTDSGGSISR